MKVILTQKVASLGNIGDMMNVASGYARNYLLPQRKAVIADESNKAELANHLKSLAGKMDADKKVAVELQSKIEGLTIKFTKKVASNGKLFGSVSSLDISKKLGELGHEVEKRLIVLPTPIKAIGSFAAKVRLLSDVQSELNIIVEMDPKQIEENKVKEAVEAKEKEALAAAKAESATTDGESEVAEADLTDEQRLDKQARDLLRS